MSADLVCSHVTVDAVGPPGQRAFYLQGADDEDTVTLLVEKQQMAVLSEHIEGLLDRLADEYSPDAVEAPPDFSLHEPVEPRFRLGAIGVGYDADRDLVLLQCEEIRPDEEDVGDGGDDEAADAPLDEDEGDEVRFWVTRTRMRTLVRRIRDVVAAGRPECRFCAKPMDDPHVCPRMN